MFGQADVLLLLNGGVKLAQFHWISNVELLIPCLFVLKLLDQSSTTIVQIREYFFERSFSKNSVVLQ